MEFKAKAKANDRGHKAQAKAFNYHGQGQRLGVPRLRTEVTRQWPRPSSIKAKAKVFGPKVKDRGHKGKPFKYQGQGQGLETKGHGQRSQGQGQAQSLQVSKPRPRLGTQGQGQRSQGEGQGLQISRPRPRTSVPRPTTDVTR